MRRWLLLALLCLTPVLAHAAPDTPYDMATVPRYYMLSADQQALVDMLYAAAAAGETSVPLPEGTLYGDAEAAVSLLTLDFPELAGLDGRYGISYYQDAPDYATGVTLYDDGDDLSARRERLIRAAAELSSRAEGTAFQRALYLHDALCAIVRYDPAGPRAHDADGALVDGAAVCEGYAQALTLLYRLAGIPCGMVTGEADGSATGLHAWNFACIGGVWCLIDVSWDDQSGGPVHWYFALSEEQMGRDHRPDDLPDLPFSSDREYHRVTEREAHTLEEAKDMLQAQLSQGRASIRFVHQADMDAFLDMLPELMACRGDYSLQYSGAQRCVLICLLSQDEHSRRKF